MPTNTGTLYVVATPIGHAGEITYRAVAVLSQVDLIVCEERKVASRLLKGLEISKPLVELNEHNEDEMVNEVLLKLIAGHDLALISDCGTPVFSDPGRKLLEIIYGSGIPVVPISGPSSLMTAISICPFNLKQFFFLGFLPPQTDKRRLVLQRYSSSPDPLILMDTPYRMAKLLDEVATAFGKKQVIFLATDLTLPSERVYLGEVQEVQAKVAKRKAEFILIIDKPERRRS